MNTETKTIRILAADDHALLRQGITSLIEIEPDMRLVEQASTGREAIKSFAPARFRPYRSPGIDGKASLPWPRLRLVERCGLRFELQRLVVAGASCRFGLADRGFPSPPAPKPGSRDRMV